MKICGDGKIYVECPFEYYKLKKEDFSFSCPFYYNQDQTCNDIERCPKDSRSWCGKIIREATVFNKDDYWMVEKEFDKTSVDGRNRDVERVTEAWRSFKNEEKIDEKILNIIKRF